VVGYEGTSEGPKQLIAEAALAIPRSVKGCPGCKTTTYFGEGAAKLYPDLQKSVKELQQKCPNCKVLFTGHSLGGAMAQNGAYQMLKDGTLKEPVPLCLTSFEPFGCHSLVICALSRNTTLLVSPKRVTRPSTKRSTK
jgi:hypothetical protein